MSAAEVEETDALEVDYDKCGTNAGWNLHRKDRTRTCDACKAAHRDYMREYRKRPGKREEGVALTRAHSRALWRLAHLHPAQFQALVAEEKRAT